MSEKIAKISQIQKPKKQQQNINIELINLKLLTKIKNALWKFHKSEFPCIQDVVEIWVKQLQNLFSLHKYYIEENVFHWHLPCFYVLFCRYTFMLYFV